MELVKRVKMRKLLAINSIYLSNSENVRKPLHCSDISCRKMYNVLSVVMKNEDSFFSRKAIDRNFSNQNVLEKNKNNFIRPKDIAGNFCKQNVLEIQLLMILDLFQHYLIAIKNVITSILIAVLVNCLQNILQNSKAFDLRIVRVKFLVKRDVTDLFSFF